MMQHKAESEGVAQGFSQEWKRGGSIPMKLLITLVSTLLVAQFAWAMSTIQALTIQAAGNSRQIESMAQNISQLRGDMEKIKDVIDRMRYGSIKP